MNLSEKRKLQSMNLSDADSKKLESLKIADAKKIKKDREIASPKNAKKKDAKKKDAKSKEIQKSIESLLIESPKGSRGINSPSLYAIPSEIWDAMQKKEKESYRDKMRKSLSRSIADILGKDRSDSERRNAIKEFKLKFKKEYQSKILSNASDIYQGGLQSRIKECNAMIKMIEIFE